MRSRGHESDNLSGRTLMVNCVTGLCGGKHRERLERDRKRVAREKAKIKERAKIT